MSIRTHAFALALLGSASLLGCSDDTTAPPADSGAADVVATDAPATDVPATDAATDASATDVPATDAPATDVPATDVPATDAATDGGIAATCVASGGTVTTSLCCQSTGNFPNTCLTGACGCAPAASHDVMTCACPSGQCFDGSRCVPR